MKSDFFVFIAIVVLLFIVPFRLIFYVLLAIPIYFMWKTGSLNPSKWFTPMKQGLSDLRYKTKSEWNNATNGGQDVSFSTLGKFFSGLFK